MDFLFFFIIFFLHGGKYIVWNIDIIKSCRLNLNDSNNKKNKLRSDSNRIYFDSMRFTSFSLSLSPSFSPSLFLFSRCSFAREKICELHYTCRIAKSAACILFIQTVSNKSEVSVARRLSFFPPFQEAPSLRSSTWMGDLYLSHNLKVEDEDSKGTIVPWEGYELEERDGGERRMNL